jgi:hypothetical protein
MSADGSHLQWQYTPALVDGMPTPVVTIAYVEFECREPSRIEREGC